MKITNETKVGALTALAITLLILGFNFLKGKSLFKTGNFLYAKVVQTKGIMVSNPVLINGYQVGAIYDLKAKSKNLDTIIVAIKLNEEINIPVNSIASIVDNPLGSARMEISKGNSNIFLKKNDTIPTMDAPGMFAEVTHQLTPVVDQVKMTLRTVDTVLRDIHDVFDPYTKHNMQDLVANLNRISAGLVVSTASIQQMLNQQSGSIAKSMDNINSFTRNLANNNDRINGTLTNLQTTTDNLSRADIDGTVNQLRQTVERLNASIEKIDSKDGTIGKLLNDTQIYDNLNNTTRSLNILMDDIRVNPKRYVSISVFGGKSKDQYLTSPLQVSQDTTGTRR
ncbi:MlaD family protein [Aridibaculum aurantiacum]|uniref:MlaD family protein n=1 Tax=Aridibaculum aurantiacum TaxID=2810307 RepID=UPI001A978025|nr:MlaD family protein [Aridibaculum aurantiacum]